jgi:ActR/RegA family two-component response regulator
MTAQPRMGIRALDPMFEGATVLLVEDDPVLRSTLAYNLSREGFRVLTAADGEAGLVRHAGRATGSISLSWTSCYRA